MTDRRNPLPFSEVESGEEENDEESHPQGHEGTRVEGQSPRGCLVLGALKERSRLDSTHCKAWSLSLYYYARQSLGSQLSVSGLGTNWKEKAAFLDLIPDAATD